MKESQLAAWPIRDPGSLPRIQFQWIQFSGEGLFRRCFHGAVLHECRKPHLGLCVAAHRVELVEMIPAQGLIRCHKSELFLCRALHRSWQVARQRATVQSAACRRGYRLHVN
jgi:hypothetical protein